MAVPQKRSVEADPFSRQESLEERIHDLEAVQKATFNILEDFASEREKLADTERAVFNILDDFSHEQVFQREVQRATFNLLDDFSEEKSRVEGVQRATFNILEDFVAEREKLSDLQRAAFNILDDLSSEKSKLTSEIAERRRAEMELANANTELEAFSYSVSHDLRAPLRGIDGFSYVLLKDYGGKIDVVGQEYLRILRSSSQQMAQLIDDLLNLSRMSRGDLYHETFDLGVTARAVMAALQAMSSGRTVDFRIPERLPAYGDPRLLRIVLENLLGNAWKFTRHRAKTLIEIRLEEVAGQLVYAIRDNGAGFDMAYADKLFGAFQRLHTAEQFPGTGIGLATVRRIINRHGGRVWAESVVDVGSTFFFSLGESFSFESERS